MLWCAHARLLPDITGNVQKNVSPNLCLDQVIVKEEEMNYKVNRDWVQVKGQAGQQQKENSSQYLHLAQQGHLNLISLSWLISGCIVCMGCSLGKAQDLAQPESLTETTFMCV